ncbi:RidA family protein [Oceanobacillus damuensis]|uniref:RidA family protein n=1 Tax=Oceanobacillus damuensis TaxID=937928 RepID=UPI000833C705|nr:RidA family protein [Oceanobacillus damuensis]
MIEKKMEQLGYPLPNARKPLYEYVPVVIHNNLAFVSGQLPRVSGQLKYCGKVGEEITIETAQEAARICIVNALTVLNYELGSLDKVKRIVKMTGFVNARHGFKDQSTVIDGASNLLVDIFGEKGQHARSAIGAGDLPGQSPVEIELIVATE